MKISKNKKMRSHVQRFINKKNNTGMKLVQMTSLLFSSDFGLQIIFPRFQLNNAELKLK